MYLARKCIYKNNTSRALCIIFGYILKDGNGVFGYNLKDEKDVFGYTQFRKMGIVHKWRQVTVVHIYRVFHLEKLENPSI